eukprot:CAMPEP_0119038170 /NCGR_PEP_ID=MMETSP1177-20130426/6894_1 /TAXON_ID=2985 /ORGANISM="Ochromonas sp, Strain CCMP1899" /LENGTH=125 /DNA_ID=CAMNT_0007000353 /DNA_START=53 /DNA_END=430 /DNA_ORIENTATION=-
MANKGFNPNNSKVSDNRLSEFLRAEISGDLSEVPGVGPASVTALNADGIQTTYQLLGKFLSLKDSEVGAVELADRFYHWLTSLGTPTGFRAGVVLSIAEKLNLTYNGIFDATEYQEDEDKDTEDA